MPSIKRSIFVNRAKGDGGGFEFHNSTIINDDKSYQLNLRAGTVAKIAEPDYDTASGPFIRVTPALLLRTMKDREANAHFLGETRIDGVDYNRPKPEKTRSLRRKRFVPFSKYMLIAGPTVIEKPTML